MYTSEDYSFEVRQNAFEYVKLLSVFNRETIKNLLNATTHHTWRFKKYARQLLDNISVNKSLKLLIEELKNH